MKIFRSTLVAILLCACAFAALAEDLPKFEMTTYYVAFLHRGPKWTPGETPESRKIQEGHMAHINDMAKQGVLLLAGPFMDDTELRGMFVFKVATAEEAAKLADGDPAVQAGRLTYEVHPWFSAKNITVTPTATK